MKYKKIILFNIFIIFFIILSKYLSFEKNIILYISFNTVGYNFKDLLSISATILAVFIGFIATIATVLVSMCDKRIMVIIKRFGKTNIVLRSIKRALLSGIISLALIGIIYVNLDFNIILLRCIIIWVTLNNLFIFIRESKFLVFLVKHIMEQTFLDNEEIVFKSKTSKKN